MGLVDTVIALAIPMKNGKTAVMVDIVGVSKDTNITQADVFLNAAGARPEIRTRVNALLTAPRRGYLTTTGNVAVRLATATWSVMATAGS